MTRLIQKLSTFPALLPSPSTTTSLGLGVWLVVKNMAVDGVEEGSKIWSELGEVVQLADDVVVDDGDGDGDEEDDDDDEEGITLGFSAVGVVERVPLGDWLFDWLSLGEWEALGEGEGDGDGVVDTVILTDNDGV